MTDPIAVVRKFIEEGINRNDFQAMLDLLADDIDYQNVPLRAARGKAEMIDFMKDMGQVSEMKLAIKNIAASGRVVFAERSDSWTMNGVKVVEPFVGVFEVNEEGRIKRWHDYFDLRSWEWSGQHPKEFFVKWARPDYRDRYVAASR